jgi:arylsulfatase A-like enzyme
MLGQMLGSLHRHRLLAFALACAVITASVALVALRREDEPGRVGRNAAANPTTLDSVVERDDPVPGRPGAPAAAPASASAATSRPRPAADDRLNIVLILTDDQRLDDLAVMPNVDRLLGAQGVTFANTFTSTPLCCPSRATLLTGQTSEHTGVLDNEPPNGGVQAFDDDSTLATWLQDAGYRTSMVGKYLNDYERLKRPFVPPGWNDWHGFLPRTPRAFYDYDLYSNGHVVGYGGEPDDYLTDVLASRAQEFVASSDRPFFLLFAPYAPHSPAVPGPGDEDRFQDEPPYRPLSYNMPATPGTPAGRLPPMSPELVRLADEHRPLARASLLSVDRAVARIVEEVERLGELDNTVFIFTSDNGLLLGEHRIVGKIWPYEASIHVPLLIRVPWRSERFVDDRLVSNLDLAPTVADLAGITPGLRTDGRSLVPLLREQQTAWRNAVFMEFRGDTPNPLVPPPYDAIRTERYKFVRYNDGSRELFDLMVDPDELADLSRVPAAETIERTLEERLPEP